MGKNKHIYTEVFLFQPVRPVWEYAVVVKLPNDLQTKIKNQRPELDLISRNGNRHFAEPLMPLVSFSDNGDKENIVIQSLLKISSKTHPFMVELKNYSQIGKCRIKIQACTSHHLNFLMRELTETFKPVFKMDFLNWPIFDPTPGITVALVKEDEYFEGEEKKFIRIDNEYKEFKRIYKEYKSRKFKGKFIMEDLLLIKMGNKSTFEVIEKFRFKNLTPFYEVMKWVSK